jgi:hypothetical protein
VTSDILAKFFTSKWTTRKTNNGKLLRKLLVDVEIQKRREKFSPRKISGDSKNDKDGRCHVVMLGLEFFSPLFPLWEKDTRNEYTRQDEDSHENPQNEFDAFPDNHA